MIPSFEEYQHALAVIADPQADPDDLRIAWEWKDEFAEALRSELLAEFGAFDYERLGGVLLHAALVGARVAQGGAR